MSTIVEDTPQPITLADRPNNSCKFELPNKDALPLATYLEQIISTLIEAVNAKDREFMALATQRFFTADVQVDRASEPFATPISAASVEEYMTNLITYIMKYDFMIRADNTSALVDEKKGKAMVFTTVSTCGTDYATKGLAIETVNTFYFRLGKDKEWRCNRFEIMRGPGRFWFDACYGYQS